MALFRHENREASDAARRLFARSEILHTSVDFAASMLFLVGSVLFLWQSLETAAIWCFIVGSVFFAMKPTIRLVREIRLSAMRGHDV